MSAEPVPSVPRWWLRPLTSAEYLALPHSECPTELEEGKLLMIPPPMPRHSRASRRLANALEPALPPGYEVLQEAGVDLELAPLDQPATIRVPDLVVARTEAFRRVDESGGVLRASEVLLVVEILSPGSGRIDRVVKRDEYADADIGHYWIVDLDPPVSVLAHRRVGQWGYADGGEITGTFRATEPFRFALDLATLL